MFVAFGKCLCICKSKSICDCKACVMFVTNLLSFKQMLKFNFYCHNTKNHDKYHPNPTIFCGVVGLWKNVNIVEISLC
jgi:hypothetical protein